MNSAATLDNLIRTWKEQGRTKAEIIVLQAEAMLGWPYTWGASGQDCTPEKRRYFMNRSSIGEGDKELIRKRCQVLKGDQSSCSGCKYYPGNSKTRIQDCQGFEKEIHKAAGITLKGGGATSMYNDNSNWSEKGPISNMPAGAVCLVFKYISATGKMDHVGQYIGGGNIIHCSGEVKRGKITEKGWTHYAIPKALAAEAGGTETNSNVSGTGKGSSGSVSRPILRKGSKGEAVKELQFILISKGYNLGKWGADGIFGQQTLATVKAFQKDNGLKVDGIVGPLTYAKLYIEEDS